MILKQIADVKTRFHNVVSKKDGVSARFKALSHLVGTDPLTIDAQTETSSEIKTWAKDSLELVFSDFGSLTDDDAHELARFAVFDPSGIILKDQYDVLNLMEVASELTWATLHRKFMRF